MKADNKLKLAGVLLGTTLITATASFAGGHDAKCGAGKCGGDKTKKEVKDAEAKCGAGKCGGDKDKEMVIKKDAKAKEKVVTKEAEAKCGAGKCG